MGSNECMDVCELVRRVWYMHRKCRKLSKLQIRGGRYDISIDIGIGLEDVQKITVSVYDKDVGEEMLHIVAPPNVFDKVLDILYYLLPEIKETVEKWIDELKNI